MYTRNIRVKVCGPRSSSISINPVGSGDGDGVRTHASLPETMDPLNIFTRGLARAELVKQRKRFTRVVKPKKKNIVFFLLNGVRYNPPHPTSTLYVREVFDLRSSIKLFVPTSQVN